MDRVGREVWIWKESNQPRNRTCNFKSGMEWKSKSITQTIFSYLTISSFPLRDILSVEKIAGANPCLGITAGTFPCVWRPGDHRIAGQQTGQIYLLGTKLPSKAWHSDVSPGRAVNKPRQRMLGHYEMLPLDQHKGNFNLLLYASLCQKRVKWFAIKYLCSIK